MRVDKRATRVTARAPRRAESRSRSSASDQKRPLGLVRPLELGFGRRKRLGREAGEAHEVDADSQRRWRPRSDLRAARRRACTIARASLSGREALIADAPDRAIDAKEAEFDPPRALRLPLQKHDEIVSKLAQLEIRSPRSSGSARRTAARRRNRAA